MLIGAGIKYWAISGHFTGTYELTIGSWQALGTTPRSALYAGLGFGIFGVGCEMFGIAANKAVVRWFRGKEMALAIGFEHFYRKNRYSLSHVYSTPIIQSDKRCKRTHSCFNISLVTWFISLYFSSQFLDKRLDQEESDAGIEKEEEFKFTDVTDIAKNRAFWYIAILCVLFYSACFPIYKICDQPHCSKILCN